MLKVIGSVRNAYVPYFVHISWHDRTLFDGGTMIRTWISDKLLLCPDIEIERFWSREIGWYDDVKRPRTLRYLTAEDSFARPLES